MKTLSDKRLLIYVYSIYGSNTKTVNLGMPKPVIDQ